MSATTSFLSEDERIIFRQPERVIPRSVIRFEPSDVKSTPRTELLGDAVASQVEGISRGEKERFRCCVISVARDDGSSWSAEALSTHLLARFPHYHQLRVTNRVLLEDLPWIASMVGQTDFLRIAARNKLTRHFLTLRSWFTPAVLGSALAVGSLSELLKQVEKGGLSGKAAHGRDLILDPMLWGPSLAVSTIGFLFQWLNTKLTTNTRAKSLEEFRQEFSRKLSTDEFGAFTAELAQRLRRGAYPRVIIVDNYEGLDLTTKRVLGACPRFS